MLVISFHDAVLRKAQGLVDIMMRTRDRDSRGGRKWAETYTERCENLPSVGIQSLVPAVCAGFDVVFKVAVLFYHCELN